MNGNGTLVETLTNSSLYSDYAQAYSEATGLPLALRPVETWQLPFHGKRKENRFCALMSGKSRTCAACLQMQEKLAQGAKEEPCTATCAYGLSETAVPVRLGSQTLGFLQTGQIFRQKPTQAQFARVAERVEKLDSDLDTEELKEAYFKTPVVSQAKMDSATNLLSIFADHLSMKSNQLAVQQANAEPPVIARAKQFILDHLHEDLSLGQVATAVHTSIFYFCKLFRKVTGITFTEFVSRARTERAKSLLLNPNLRVSEIAYEVGFQSLTHFNRVFKTVAGESPTAYRDRLPKTSGMSDRAANPRSPQARRTNP
jgi:AraC-like DNA-binding protein/ligand-binding sensor protein